MKDFIPDLTTMLRRVFSDKHINDIFSVQELVRGDEKSGLVAETKYFIKSYLGVKKVFTDKEVFRKLINEIKMIVGPQVLIDIKTGEGNKLQWVAGKEKESNIDRKFNYQFEITIISKLGGRKDET